MDIFTLGSDILREKALPVKNFDAKCTSLAFDMLETLRKSGGVGLAGPQVGLKTRIFVSLTEKEGAIVFINPSIIETSPELSPYEEGCLSVPGVWEDVIRPKSIVVQAWNTKGRPFTIEASGVLARIIQHEYDHLEGKLFIDHLSAPKRERLLAKYKKLIERAQRHKR